MRSLHDVLIEAASHSGVSPSSRRSVLALVAAAPAAFGVQSVLATAVAGGGYGNGGNRGGKHNHNHNHHHHHNNGGNGGKGGSSGKGKKSDIAVLNYALTLEHLEFAFYRDALGQGGFVASDFTGFLDPNLFDRLKDIRDHEGAHVDTLTQVIQSLGGNPVAELCYDFGYANADQFLAVAQALENTGVMAYDGAIAGIKSGDLQTAGATIATVEARHASYLNLINDDNPFPDAFDTPKSQQQILAIAGQFIVDCP